MPVQDKRSPIALAKVPLGHSAGGPVALAALAEVAEAEAEERGSTYLPPGCYLAGVVLIAPAALSPREDPEVFQAASSEEDEEEQIDRVPQEVPAGTTAGQGQEMDPHDNQQGAVVPVEVETTAEEVDVDDWGPATPRSPHLHT